MLCVLTFLWYYLLLGKGSALCNYGFALGKPYATDWCNSEVTIEGDETSWKVRCLSNGTAVLDYFYNKDCSGNADEISQVVDYRCGGTETCYASITTYYGISSYYEDVPCTKEGSYYIFEVLATGECLYEQDSGRTRIWNCADGVLITTEYKEQTCTNEKYSPNVKRDTCADGSKNTSQYKINCDVSTPPTPAPTKSLNQNDAASCSYVDWDNIPIAPNQCLTQSRVGTEGKSVMFKCSDDNSRVDKLDYTTADCSGPSTTTAWTSYFNCIGDTSCHSDYWGYENAQTNDSTCSMSTETVSIHYIFATDVCMNNEDSSGSHMATCHDTYVRLETYSSSNCEGDVTNFVYGTGCLDQDLSSHYQLFKLDCPNKDMSSGTTFIFDGLTFFFVSTLGFFAVFSWI